MANLLASHPLASLLFVLGVILAAVSTVVVVAACIVSGRCDE